MLSPHGQQSGLTLPTYQPSETRVTNVHMFTEAFENGTHEPLNAA